MSCPVGPCDIAYIASGRTQQKTSFLAARILHRHAASGAVRVDNTASDSSSIVACSIVASLSIVP
jgi:hypothetical protein